MTTLQKNRVGQLFPGGLREFDNLVTTSSAAKAA